ncbi:hypothetical protein [Spiroplasma melliferum]|uniref:Lipoprotein n=2 Tax=Spiroplasma melliferum TaxID=2134 RepID=A0AAI9T4B4_SPIME|nr:hypothetical protein [Spiroplasma melliferum]ELL44636.1 hypothetical protein SMIPMB4A_v3c4140 [Spiroplasma melliferum IPMB4A]KAI92972.1 hypothetical protein SPM_003075 [Spiroplasma melliferum KC3]QCO23855.1 hypothetical protein SRED_002331 [Spiroplasma melliferum]
MKKLLSLLGIGLLTTTGTTSVLACQKQRTDYSDSKDDDKNNGKDDNKDKENQDLETFNNIIRMAKTGFQDLLFKEVVLGNTSDLLKGYEWVSKKEPRITLQGNNSEHQALINYFLAMFRDVYNIVNQQIINEYPNYYLNSDPLSFNDDDYVISLNFIDLKQMNESLDLKIEGIEKVKAVRIDFNIKYDVKFKSLISTQECQTNFNMTNNVEIFSKLYDGSFIYFQNNLLQWLSSIKTVKLNEGYFKSLYDDFYLDFGMDDSNLDSKYKMTLKEFIKSNQQLAKLDISYNEESSFTWIKNSLIEHHRPSDKGLDFDYLSRNRLKHWGGNEPSTAKAESFVKQYKQLVPKLDQITNNMLNLATLALKLDYINIYGMTLKGYMKDSQNVIFESNVRLSADALNTKLSNFGNLIITFLKFYNITYDGIRFNFQVNAIDFDQIVKNGLENKTILKTLFKIFKSSNVGQNLVDINLFNFTQANGYPGGANFGFNGSNHLIFSTPDPGGFDATFYFGRSPSIFYYTPFQKFFGTNNEVIPEDQYGVQKV